MQTKHILFTVNDRFSDTNRDWKARSAQTMARVVDSAVHTTLTMLTTGQTWAHTTRATEQWKNRPAEELASDEQSRVESSRVQLQ